MIDYIKMGAARFNVRYQSWRQGQYVLFSYSGDCVAVKSLGNLEDGRLVSTVGQGVPPEVLEIIEPLIPVTREIIDAHFFKVFGLPSITSDTIALDDIIHSVNPVLREQEMQLVRIKESVLSGRQGWREYHEFRVSFTDNNGSGHYSISELSGFAIGAIVLRHYYWLQPIVVPEGETV